MKAGSYHWPAVCLVAALVGCAPQTKVLRPDWQNPDHKRVGAQMVPLLRSAGRDPRACKVFFFELDALNAVSMGECTFGFSTGLVATGDERLIRGVGAHEVAHEVLGHADKRKAAAAAEQVVRTAVSFIPGIGGLVASSAVLVAGMLGLPAYSRSQEAEADNKAVEILQAVGDSDPAGTMVHTFQALLARHGEKGGGLLDTHPGTGDRLEAMRNLQVQQPGREGPPLPFTAAAPPQAREETSEKSLSVAPTTAGTRIAKPELERPTYSLGDRWFRSDGEYRLVRIEKDRYIFSAGGGHEIHLTKDLLVARMQRGGWTTEFESLPTLPWPLEVGRWGTGMGTWHVPNDPRGTLVVKYTWTVEAYEDVHITAGTFKAFRIVLSWEPLVGDVITSSSYPRKDLVSWYSPEVRQLIKAECPGLTPLNFQVLSVEPRGGALPTKESPVLHSPATKPSSPASIQPPAEGGSFTLEERLRRLKDLREKDLITEEDYQAAKQELLRKLTE